MIRLLLRLIGIKDFDNCKSCETLKEQLIFERAEKKELTETLLTLIRPKVVEQPVVELAPIVQSTGSWSKRRAILEANEREDKKIVALSTNIGKPDNSVEKLEQELGLEKKEA